LRVREQCLLAVRQCVGGHARHCPRLLYTFAHYSPVFPCIYSLSRPFQVRARAGSLCKWKKESQPASETSNLPRDQRLRVSGQSLAIFQAIDGNLRSHYTSTYTLPRRDKV